MKLKEFKSLIYREGIGKVTSPPYDILKGEDGLNLLDNPYNIANLMSGSTFEDPFTKIQEWLEKGVISLQENSFILLKQIFDDGVNKSERYGIIGILDLREEENKLRIHENVIPSFVEERKTLISAMKAQIEPVFVVTDSRKLHDILDGISSRMGCDRSYEQPDGVWNRICVIEDNDDISRIKDELRNRMGIIADGHHRTRALTELSREIGATEECFNYLLAYVTSIWEPSTEIGPVHRIIRKWPGFMEDLNTLFEVHDHTTDSHICMISEGKLYSLNHRESGKHSADSFIVEELLDMARKKGYNPMVSFWPSREEAMKEMEGDTESALILLPAFEKEQFMGIVEKGITLPPKSTYFYPKIPSGITFYPMWPEVCHCSSGGRAADS